MYWPIGTPRIYATSSSRAPGRNLFVSYDGLQQPPDSGSTSSLDTVPKPRTTAAHEDVEVHPPPTPLTPATPSTPVVQSIDYDDVGDTAAATSQTETELNNTVPLKDPVLALRVARAGHIFVVITATSITVWQTKVSSVPCPVTIKEVCVTNAELLIAYGNFGSRGSLGIVPRIVWHQRRHTSPTGLGHISGAYIPGLPHHIFDSNRRRIERLQASVPQSSQCPTT